MSRPKPSWHRGGPVAPYDPTVTHQHAPTPAVAGSEKIRDSEGWLASVGLGPLEEVTGKGEETDA